MTGKEKQVCIDPGGKIVDLPRVKKGARPPPEEALERG